MPASRLVGEAYVLMRADGRLLKRDMKAAGQGAGKALTNEFDKEIERSADTMQRRFKSAVAESFVGQDFSRFRKEFGSVEATVDGLRKKLRALTYDQNGALLPSKDRQLLARTYKDIVKELEAWGKAEQKVEQQLADSKALKDREAAIARTAKAYATYGRNIEYANTRSERALADQNKAWLSYARNVEHTNTRVERALEEQNKAWLTYGRNVNAGFKVTAIREQDEAWSTYRENIAHTTRELDKHSSSVEYHSSRVVRSMRTLREQLDLVGDRSDRFGTIVGRAFGKGSRNNFLNFIGSVVSGLFRLSSAVITFPFRLVAHVGDAFGTAFSASKAANAGNLLSIGRGILGVFGGKGGLIGLVAGTALALVGFGKVLPGVVSLLTMLGGAASALVGSIGIGLTGALLAVTPAAVGAVSALGSVVGVIATFAKDKANKDFMESIFTRPLQKLTKEVTPQIKTFLRSIRSGFKVLLDDLQPSIETFFDTFKTKMNDVDKRTKGSKTKPGDIISYGTIGMLEKWSESIGRMATSLNNAVTSFGSGLVGFFAPVLPYAEKLTTYIDNLATRFDAWANSPKGQNAIADFMKDAWVNAKLVWDILGEIGSIIGTVFSSGDKTGSSFLTGIRDKLKEIDAFLDTPEGRSKLDAFFGDVKTIGQDFGELALSVGGIIKNLNSPEARESAKGMADSLVKIGNAAESISKTADAVGRLVDYLSNPAMALLTDVVGFITGNAGKGVAGPAPFQPQTVPSLPKYSETPTPIRKDQMTEFVATLKVNPKMNQEELTKVIKAVEAYQSTGVTIPIKGNKDLWEQVRGTVLQQIFPEKSVPVDGNEDAWNKTKGTVSAFVFKPKVVQVKGDTSDLNAKIAAARAKLRTLGVTVPIAGAGRQGGITFGDSASGRIVNGPHLGLTGEAGPEAIVPLRRPLHLVDPSVRALSAVAQGMRMPGMASGGVAGGGTTIAEGAVNLQITTAAHDPYTVGAIVKDDLLLALQSV